jgi:hypothetical protein
VEDRSVNYLSVLGQLSLLFAALVVLVLSVPVNAQVSGLQSGSNLIQPVDLPHNIGIFLEVMGSRMTTPEMAQVTFAGTTSDSKGSRAAQIIVQSPGYMSYREGLTRAVTFNGSQMKGNAAALTDDDKRVSESLMTHLPDAIFLQIATGGTLRRVGGHFRTDSTTSKNYSGPYWTVFAFSPKNRTGLARGDALQQELFICIDESTGLVSEVRTVVNTGPKQRRVVQTQFSNWSKQAGQWFPGQIVRLEDGVQTLSFNIQQAISGPAVPVTAFEP